MNIFSMTQKSPGSVVAKYVKDLPNINIKYAFFLKNETMRVTPMLVFIFKYIKVSIGHDGPRDSWNPRELN